MIQIKSVHSYQTRREGVLRRPDLRFPARHTDASRIHIYHWALSLSCSLLFTLIYLQDPETPQPLRQCQVTRTAVTPLSRHHRTAPSRLCTTAVTTHQTHHTHLTSGPRSTLCTQRTGRVTLTAHWAGGAAVWVRARCRPERWYSALVFVALPVSLSAPLWFDETLGCRAYRHRGGVVEGVGCVYTV